MRAAEVDCGWVRGRAAGCVRVRQTADAAWEVRWIPIRGEIIVVSKHSTFEAARTAGWVEYAKREAFSVIGDGT